MKAFNYGGDLLLDAQVTWHGDVENSIARVRIKSSEHLRKPAFKQARHAVLVGSK